MKTLGSMSCGKGLLLLFISLLGLVGTLLIDPIPQDPNFHLFADTRTCLGISNFGNTASNIVFAIIGSWGIWITLGPKGNELFISGMHKLPYVVFYIGIFLVSIGSGYYHWSPDNERLFWDRLPMTIAFMGFFVACLTDRLGQPALVKWLLPLSILLGAGSVIYWAVTESQGSGDLRFYGFIQFFPILILPLVCKFYPRWNYTNGKYLFWIVVCYTFALLLEKLDYWIYDLFFATISGHTLKHLFASVSAFIVAIMLQSKRINED